MDTTAAAAFVSEQWDSSILPALCAYIAVPNQSPHFDPHWHENGLMEQAMKIMTDWVQAQALPQSSMHVYREPGRTPLLFIEVAPTLTGEHVPTVLLYGHMDKQPPGPGWHEDLGPYQPVIKGGRLYGRGGADDGYAIFSAITAIQALKRQGVPHGRCVIIIEACEESGSPDLKFYVELLREKIGEPSLVVCLDSGASDYERMWLTTSLRGLVVGDLSVETLTEGVHSGDASGIVPDTFRIARRLLERLEDSASGRILPPQLHVQVSPSRLQEITTTVGFLGDKVWKSFPFAGSTTPPVADNVELTLNRTWRPQLAVTGAAGLPDLASAGNVLRPRTVLRLSLRIPPTLPGPEAAATLKQLLEQDPPHGARVSLAISKSGTGWSAPEFEPWLKHASEAACQAHFGASVAFHGEGGSIPFMGMLGKMFPKAQLLITGVLGPNSNAHGPNEFLDIAYAKKITSCVVSILAAHAATA